MKSNDVPIGAGLLVLGTAHPVARESFPPAPGQPYNAALVPGIAAAGLAFAAMALIDLRPAQEAGRAQGRGSRGRQGAGPGDASPAGQDVEVLETAEVPSRLLAILLTAAAIGFYLLAANFLGFIITGAIILAVLMWAFGVRLQGDRAGRGRRRAGDPPRLLQAPLGAAALGPAATDRLVEPHGRMASGFRPGDGPDGDHDDHRLGPVRPVRRRRSGPDGDDGHRAAGADHLLPAADRCRRRDRHGNGDGDLRRRHSRLPDAHTRARRRRPPMSTTPTT